MAELSRRYKASFTSSFVHPALIRCAIEYHPQPGFDGPVFRDDLVLTPDGILSTTQKISSDAITWGVTWPLLANDGAPLAVTVGARFGETEFKGHPDSESFLALGKHPSLDSSGETVRSTYGDLQPVLQMTKGMSNQTFIYPHTIDQPSSLAVIKSFAVTADGFSSVLGRVSGNVYVGQTVAGGEGASVSIQDAGKPDVTFSEPCRFLLQLHHGRVIAAEADRRVHADLQGKQVDLTAYTPVMVK
jgi:hypothetical protein